MEACPLTSSTGQRMLHGPPILSFNIERHGSTGRFGPSKQAEIQSWELDLDNRTKGWGPDGFRLLEPRDPVVKTKPLAEKYADLITNQAPDPALKYLSGGDCVRVSVAKVAGVGDTNAKGQKLAKQTFQTRRKRFREELKRLLVPAGWQMTKMNLFCREHQP